MLMRQFMLAGQFMTLAFTHLYDNQLTEACSSAFQKAASSADSIVTNVYRRLNCDAKYVTENIARSIMRDLV
ncbi:e2f49fd5-85bb-4a8c-b88d-5afaa1954ce9 [Sclerotinia trifoliorum]|uniref:E2f49fd5-85bb-4a8c-b88d-5afaa1954ce9 n=1 Tax=Sclerotinia trifoliorum TaxID=28548 RepID=A0A8H2VZA1_9HELO|nr:e2f49fd5-85bb-4a8c-b88d-5afaa1954ce9 [Sclerotinia trifoliorum]